MRRPVRILLRAASWLALGLVSASIFWGLQKAGREPVGWKLFIAYTLICGLVGAVQDVFFWYHVKWRLPRPGFCTKCGYDLTGNASGVCPECGMAIQKQRTASK